MTTIHHTHREETRLLPDVSSDVKIPIPGPERWSGLMSPHGTVAGLAASPPVWRGHTHVQSVLPRTPTGSKATQRHGTARDGAGAEAGPSGTHRGRPSWLGDPLTGCQRSARNGSRPRGFTTDRLPGLTGPWTHQIICQATQVAEIL